MGVLVVLVLLALVGWIIFTQTQARKQLSVHTSQGRTAVQQAVDEVFGRSWTRVKGPGHINVKAKLRAHAPTVSVDVAPGGQGGSDVTIWMSAWRRRYGVVAHAQLVWRKERQLSNRLASPGAPSSMVAPRPSSAGRAPAATWGVSASGNTGSGPSKVAGRPAAPPKNNPGNDNGQSALVCKTIEESDCSFIVRTPKEPRQIAEVVERSLKGVQRGSTNHLLIGPPRATMWAYILESRGFTNILAISLMTKDNPDRDYVKQSIQAPLELALSSLDGSLEVRSEASTLGDLRHEILKSRVISVSEYSSESPGTSA